MTDVVLKLDYIDDSLYRIRGNVDASWPEKLWR
jgi:hypothetical protein